MSVCVYVRLCVFCARGRARMHVDTRTRGGENEVSAGGAANLSGQEWGGDSAEVR